MHEQLAILAAFVFLYSLVSGRVERSVVSGPMVFVAAGFIMGPVVLGWFSGEDSRYLLRTLADLTLALCLFTDSANANRRTLERYSAIPARMLLLGLPGAILLGFLAAQVLFDSLTIYEAAALGAMLAATDAALGRPVITNPRVPSRLREGLNVESGLNDGLCVPVLFFFIALEVGSEEGVSHALAVKLLAGELGIGLAVGVVLASAGAAMLHFCWKRQWVSDIWVQATTVALALACFAVAQSLHGSGYIAAFCGGFVFGYLARDKIHELTVPAEGIGDVLALLTWTLFGIAVVGQVLGEITWQVAVYVVLSLTVVRMLPIYLSLAGSGEPAADKAFLGWFGPRGLASIVFTVIIYDTEMPGAELMTLVVTCTVLASLVVHGMTANPLARRFARD